LLAAKKKMHVKAVAALPRKKQVRKILTETVTQPAPKHRALSVAVILVLVLTACVTISRFAEISRNHSQIVSLERALRNRQDATELLNLELTSRKDLNRIERIAATEIGMKHPDETQVQYVVLADFSDDEPNEPSETQLTADSGQSLWERILRLLIP